MHDGIQKFDMELNGVMIRTLPSNMKVTVVPWMLKEIPSGSLNAEKLVTHLIDVIKSVKPLGNKAADVKISRLLLEDTDGLNFPKPPKYFKLWTVRHVVNEQKVINLELPNWLVAINADGMLQCLSCCKNVLILVLCLQICNVLPMLLIVH